MSLRAINGGSGPSRGPVGRLSALCVALAAALAVDAGAQPPSKARARPAASAADKGAAQAQAVNARAGAAEPITLNFKDAEIESVVAAFAHFLKRTFIVDPRVKGKITLETPQPVGRARAYELLQASLRVQGFAIVESGTLSRVVPEADAKLQAGPVGVGGQTDRSGEQVMTQVFRLNYESASNLVPVLRPLITANNTVTAYPSNNSLVITDYAANLQRLAQIIASLDSPSTSEVEVVPVKNAVAAELALTVARMIDDTSRAGQGAQVDPGQRVAVLADPRLNSVMIRTSSAAKMNLAKSLLSRLDQPSTEPGNIRVVYLRNAEAVRLAQVLRGVLVGDASGQGGGAAGGFGTTGQGGIGGFGGTGAGTGTGGFGQTQAGSAGGALSTGAGGAQGGLSSTNTAGLQSGTQGQQTVTFSAGGAIIAADPATNSLIITASDPVYRNLRAVIDRLDARRAQVFIESLIVEVSAERAAELGVQWQFLNGLNSDTSRVFGGTNLTARNTGSNILDLTTNPLSGGQGLNLGVVKGAITVGGETIFNIGLLARALESRANANILATPNLLTLDNEEARIIIGQNVPFLTGSFTSAATTGGAVNPFQTIERRDVGTTLRVKPQVSESGSVRMQIFQETSSVLTNTAQGLITNRRAIESNVLVDDGQIVVLGGLIEEKVEGDVQKVPGLGDLPVMGQLFRYDSRKRVKTNLLVFLKPVVLRDSRDSHGLTNDRYEYMRNLQGDSRLPQHWALPEFPPSDLVPMSPVPGQKPVDGQRGPASLVPEIDANAAARRAAGTMPPPSTPLPGASAPGASAPGTSAPGTSAPGGAVPAAAPAR